MNMSERYEFLDGLTSGLLVAMLMSSLWMHEAIVTNTSGIISVLALLTSSLTFLVFHLVKGVILLRKL